MRDDQALLFAAAAVMIGAGLYAAPDIRAALARIGPAWERLHPEVKRRAELVLEDAAREFGRYGLRVGVHDGWRTLEQQQVHIGSGASFVSDALNSFHPWGLAADFVFINRLGAWTWLADWPEQGREHWYALGRIIERYGFRWGGRWGAWGSRQFDGPHAELPLMPTAELRATYGLPVAYVRTFA